MAKKNKVGRPTKYDKKYCDELIKHMSDGYTYESFAGLIQVSHECLYEWERKHKEFSDAKKIGRSAQLLYDERMSRAITIGKIPNASASMHIFKMKNCHGWRDKQDVNHTSSDGSLTVRFIKPEENAD